MSDLVPDSQPNELLFYTTPDGKVTVQVSFKDDTFWLSQKQISELFGVDRTVVTKHIGNIYEEGELNPEATSANFALVQDEGGRQVSRNVAYYSLDAIIAVGYRISSHQATQFRIWATQTLKEFLIKGFVLDDVRLKQGQQWGKDYFDELLEKIREIRASERRFYQKITDIYAQCSVDYQKDAPVTQTFYATVQNKLHWAITGHTAAEVIKDRADCTQPHMGLTTWKNAPQGKILKTDVAIAKNYLNEKEIKDLNRIVNMYLDFAELQAERQNPMRMQDWVTKLDAFLQFNEYDVLKNAGTVSAEVAKQLAHAEYEKYRPIQDQLFESDFDRMVKKLKPPKPRKSKGETADE